MDSRKIIYLILLATITGLAIVHLETVHTQSVSHMINLQAREQELIKEVAQQQVYLNSGVNSPQKLIEQIKSLNLEMKPIMDLEIESEE